MQRVTALFTNTKMLLISRMFNIETKTNDGYINISQNTRRFSNRQTRPLVREYAPWWL